MKAHLIFNLPEENSEYKAAVFAMEWYLTVWDLKEEVFSKLDNGHKFKTPDEALEYVLTYINDTLEHYCITLDMIT